MRKTYLHSIIILIVIVGVVAAIGAIAPNRYATIHIEPPQPSTSDIPPEAPATTTIATTTPVTPSALVRTLKIGDSFVYEDTAVTFQDVPSDSRCAINVQCVWAGEIVTRFTLKNKDNVVETIDVKNTDSASSTLYTLHVQDIKPDKTTTAPIIKKNYQVRILIERKK